MSYLSARLVCPCCTQRETWRSLWSISPSIWRVFGGTDGSAYPTRNARSPGSDPVGAARCERCVRQRRIFSYHDGHKVFSKLNLHLEPGQRIGLIGRSGSGKATLFALLQRLQDVQSGRILIDGQDISRVTQESLRASISVVPQDTSLFQRSLMENIRYGRPDASDQEVLEAATAARCIDFIKALPAGFVPVAGEKGAKLSGRPSANASPLPAHSSRSAPILLLDEATSSLNAESEEAIRAAQDSTHARANSCNCAPDFKSAQFRPDYFVTIWPDCGWPS